MERKWNACGLWVEPGITASLWNCTSPEKPHPACTSEENVSWLRRRRYILNPSLSIECLSWVHLFTPWHQGHCVVTMCCRDEETAHWLFIKPVVLPRCGNWKDHPYSTACSARLSIFPHSLFFGFYLPFISHSQSCFLLPIGTQPCVFFQRLTWLGLASWSSNHDLLLCAHEWRAEPQLPGLPVFLN